MKRIVISCLLVGGATLFWAQRNVKDLEDKKRSVQEQIELTNKLLNQTSRDVNSKLNNLKLVGKQIDNRKKLIRNIEGDIVQINKEQVNIEGNINVLERDLNNRRKRYADAMRSIWAKRSTVDHLLFILSAESLTQTLRRARYLNEYAVWIKLQGEELKEKQQELEGVQQDLDRTKSTKVTLLTKQEIERKQLEQERQKENKVYNELSKKKKELQTDLNKQRRQALDLDRQIQRIIQEEARKAAEEARRRAAAEAAARAARERAAKGQKVEKEKEDTVEPRRSKGSQPQSLAYSMTKEEQELSSDFSRNQGRLPMPIVGKYVLVGRYGQQAHPVLKHVTINNSGIDLQTTAGTDACCVFNGEVSRVFKMQGYSYSVIVRHGNYLTVYSNLSQVYVKAGNKVKTRQSLGRIYSDPDEGNKTILHFQIWKELNKMNPQSWLDM